MAQPTLESREGQLVPQVDFRLRQDGEWKTVSSEELFAGRNVVVFSLPGAFTPTCSSTHLPRYNALVRVFREHGIDQVICIAVNDPFVMEEWGKEQECGDVLLLPDGNGAFTEAMGMLVDKADLNFGKRSWRYSMLVRDGVIEKMFIEEDVPGDPFQVSDADTMLSYLGGKAPADILLFTRPGCVHCARAKAALHAAGLPYAELPTSPRILRALPGGRSTPQVYVNGQLLGGADELEAWIAAR